MQTKGFIRILTILLILVCAFYLSFTFVANKYETEGEEIAMKAANIQTPDMSNEAYKKAYNDYMDKIVKQNVYLGYTYQEVREKQLGLGLDLKGGMNVTLQISVPDILKALAKEHATDKKFLQAISNVEKDRTAQDDYVASFCQEYKRIGGGNLRSLFRNVQKVKDNPEASDNQIEGFLKDEVNSMVDNSYNVLRSRIDKFGVVAPNIQKLQSTGRILLELPGIKEPERVKKLLQGTANLEFYETYENKANIAAGFSVLAERATNELKNGGVQAVADSTTVADSVAAPMVAKTDKADKSGKKVQNFYQLLTPSPRAGTCIFGHASAEDTAQIMSLVNKYRSELPNDMKFCWTVKPEENGRFALIGLKTTSQHGARMTGDVVNSASSEYDNLRRSYKVNMTMNDEGSRQWSRMTADNVGHSVAVVLDDLVYSYPNVQNQIDGGRTEITGNFTVEDANDLSNVLQSGKMAAKVNVVSESVIGPSLGQESINKGMISFVIALVLLMILMISVYGFKAGSIANLGLIFNLFFTIGILASFQSVLTLPGIAGIVLSLGMAVDANVLIFERCKEELRNGKNLKAAINDGYSNAFSAIFDGNLTSVITGIILILNGTGPIKGFAVTLVIGICCSFFTAVFVTRLILEHFVNKNSLGFGSLTFTSAWAKNLLQGTSFDFVGRKKRYLAIVSVIVAVMLAMFFIRPLNLGIDFSGGRNYVVQFDHPVSTTTIQNKLAPEFPHATVSVITIDNNTKVRVSTNYKVEQNDSTVDNEIMGKLYKGMQSDLNGMSFQDFSVSNEKVGIQSQDAVGPSIASDMARDAIIAVMLSLLAMGLYILLRFRNVAFSLGALAAVTLTTFVVIGFFTLHGILPFSMEVDQTFIAAILTVIGYQINDTVVVFDRVREYRHLFPKQDEKTRFNNALNSTLSRTMMTSLSTLLVLLVIFILGGESIRAFNFAMILGVIIGTCCSLFVAAPVAHALVSRSGKKKA